MNNVEEKEFAKKIIQCLDESAISSTIENKLKLARQYALLNKKQENFETIEMHKKWNIFGILKKPSKESLSINIEASSNKILRSAFIKPTIVIVAILSVTTFSTLSIIHVDNTNNILGKSEEFIQKDVNDVQSYQDEIDNDYDEMIQSNN
jgi:glutamine amidotransferase PdxT